MSGRSRSESDPTPTPGPTRPPVPLVAATPLDGQNHPTQGTSTAPRRDGERKYTVAQIAEFGVARPTIYRHLAEAAV
jgi:hypothetical protein